MKNTQKKIILTIGAATLLSTTLLGNVSVAKNNNTKKSQVKQTGKVLGSKIDNKKLPVLKEGMPQPELIEEKEMPKNDLKAIKYERIMNLLSAVDEKGKDGGKTALENEQDKKNQELKSEQVEMIEEFLLPTPIGSIKMHGELVVYAEIKINVVNYADKSPGVSVKKMFENESMAKPEHFTLESLSLGYTTKKIKIRKGDTFGFWSIKEVNGSYVEYIKSNTNQTIRKFY